MLPFNKRCQRCGNHFSGEVEGDEQLQCECGQWYQVFTYNLYGYSRVDNQISFGRVPTPVALAYPIWRDDA